MGLEQLVLAGDRLALSRLLTQVENETPEGQTALDFLYPYTGQAHLVGITGSPGTGKSSLANQLAQAFRRKTADRNPVKVAVVAVDPSSPFTGGAILGDRVRMRELLGDSGVFVRSMANRGALGGLARTTSAVVQVLDEGGYAIIFIETVGAGQSEVDIARLAHSTIVVESPGLGDEIQAIKAGILEIADVLVVNKADKPGVENTERALRNMLEMGHPTRPFKNASGKDEIWIPPVLRVVALDGTGVEELAAAVIKHRQFLVETGEWNRRERERQEKWLDNMIQARLIARWREGLKPGEYESIITKLIHREISPYQAMDKLGVKG